MFRMVIFNWKNTAYPHDKGGTIRKVIGGGGVGKTTKQFMQGKMSEKNSVQRR